MIAIFLMLFLIGCSQSANKNSGEVSFKGNSKCDEQKVRNKQHDLQYYTNLAENESDFMAQQMWISKAKTAANELKWALKDCGK